MSDRDWRRRNPPPKSKLKPKYTAKPKRPKAPPPVDGLYAVKVAAGKSNFIPSSRPRERDKDLFTHTLPVRQLICRNGLALLCPRCGSDQLFVWRPRHDAWGRTALIECVCEVCSPDLPYQEPKPGQPDLAPPGRGLFLNLTGHSGRVFMYWTIFSKSETPPDP